MANNVSSVPVAFEVDRVDPDSVAWSVLVRGSASSVTETEVLDLAKSKPAVLAPAPGERFFAIRPDVLTGRRFSLREAR